MLEFSSNFIGIQIVFTPDDSIRDVLGFKSKVIHEEYNLSDYPVVILAFDNIFLECDIAPGKIFKSRRSGIIHSWTKTVDPGSKNVEKLAAGITCYMMNTNDFISSIFLKKTKTMNLYRSMDKILLSSDRLQKFSFFNQMTMTLNKSRYKHKNEKKSKPKTPKGNTSTNLPPNLQSFKPKTLSENTFVVYE